MMESFFDDLEHYRFKKQLYFRLYDFRVPIEIKN
jgi:hypothetical protein